MYAVTDRQCTARQTELSDCEDATDSNKLVLMLLLLQAHDETTCSISHEPFKGRRRPRLGPAGVPAVDVRQVHTREKAMTRRAGIPEAGAKSPGLCGWDTVQVVMPGSTPFMAAAAMVRHGVRVAVYFWPERTVLTTCPSTP